MSQSKKQLAHLFDATQCIGCSACIVACAQTNYPEMVERENEGWNWLAANIRKVTLERALHRHLPLRRELPRSRNGSGEDRREPLRRLQLLHRLLPVRRSLVAPGFGSADEVHGRRLRKAYRRRPRSRVRLGLSGAGPHVRRHQGSEVGHFRASSHVEDRNPPSP